MNTLSKCALSSRYNCHQNNILVEWTVLFDTSSRFLTVWRSRSSLNTNNLIRSSFQKPRALSERMDMSLQVAIRKRDVVSRLIVTLVSANETVNELSYTLLVSISVMMLVMPSTHAELAFLQPSCQSNYKRDLRSLFTRKHVSMLSYIDVIRLNKSKHRRNYKKTDTKLRWSTLSKAFAWSKLTNAHPLIFSLLNPWKAKRRWRWLLRTFLLGMTHMLRPQSAQIICKAC